MDRVRTSENDAKTSVIAAEIYPQTMGKHHSWVLRKMAALAMMTLPLRKDLITTMCKQNEASVEDLLKDIVTVATPQHTAINEYLVRNGIIDE